jgi:hypothetical protein
MWQEGEQPALESWFKRHYKPLALTMSCLVFAVLLLVPIFKEVEKQNCLAMLAFVSLLWCTEVSRPGCAGLTQKSGFGISLWFCGTGLLPMLFLFQ